MLSQMLSAWGAHDVLVNCQDRDDSLHPFFRLGRGTQYAIQVIVKPSVSPLPHSFSMLAPCPLICDRATVILIQV